jgi:hypothetical protein
MKDVVYRRCTDAAVRKSRCDCHRSGEDRKIRGNKGFKWLLRCHGWQKRGGPSNNTYYAIGADVSDRTSPFPRGLF